MNTNKLFTSFVSMGTRLILLASMLMTGLIGQVTSVAAAPPQNMLSVTVGAQSGTLAYGTAGDATFSISVLRGSPNSTTPTSFSLIVTGLPAGATATSGLGPFTFSTNPRVVSLTIHSNGSVAVGPDGFSVQASGSGPDPIGSGTLTIVQGSQTISFAALPNKTFGDPDFNVSATASSGLAVSFTASGNCTVAGTLVHLTGVGSCTVTAAQAGNTNYSAATSVPQIFTINAAGPVTSFDLYAVSGSTTLPGAVTATVWGYNTTNALVSQPGGPVLIVDQGANVSVTLHNQLPGGESTSLLFQGQSLVPDTVGASSGGGTMTYNFTASKPGTFVYEAGLMLNSQHQVAMGLYGVLLVRPTGFPLAAPGQAYDSVSTAFDAEQVLVLSELDPVLNGSATPASFDMRKYAPKYFLINGKAYPATADIPVTAGNRVLLRYVNAGLQSHAMSLLGLTQTVVATDGNPFTFSHKMTSETIAPGQTLDALVSAPASVAAGSKFPLYDANMLLRNNTGITTSAGLGGMLTFLTVGTPVVGPDITGPLLSSVTLTPNPNTGVSVALAFTANDTTTGNSNVTAAEYWVDAGAHTAITISGPASPIKNLTATIPAQSTGTHIVSVRAQDAALNWSATTTINLVVDTVGPTTSGLTLTPNPSNGTVGVDLSFNADDSGSGNSNVTAAEYWIDSGVPVPIAISSPAPVKTVNVTIPSGLGVGSHTVHVRSQDVLSNWGAEATISLVVDNVGPSTSGVSAAPNPNNGALPLNTTVQAVRVSASFSDASSGGSNISTAEGFFDVAGATGTGFPFVANDGNFNSPTESGFADVPLAVINTLTNGDHPICIHAKDAVGNWGAMNCSYNLTIDRTPPTVSSIDRVTATPTSLTSVQFLVTFSESVTGVTSSNFTIVRTGLTGTSTITSVTGTGATRTVTATTGTGSGTIGLNLTSPTGITDLAGNALTSAGLPFVGQVYTVTPPSQPSLYFSTSGNTNPPGVGGTADDADIYFYNGSAFSRNIDLTAAPYSIASSNVDGFDRVSATQFYMSFDGTVTVPGIGSVQDEDVVFYNAGTWSVYFDGTPAARGLGGSDLDAISVVGGILYFSTDDTDVPAGVSGGGDDADIYSWNGTSFARVVNASDVGWSTTNVDGLVWVDATHVYLSYSSDTTAPGSLSVQDEDVVRNNGGTWSTYFDGTALLLTSGNLDIDAFDLP